jgi:hypothetical protein
LVISSWPLAKKQVPLTLKLMSLCPGLAFAWSMASRKLPGSPSVRVVTTKSAGTSRDSSRSKYSQERAFVGRLLQPRPFHRLNALSHEERTMVPTPFLER